MPNFAFAPLERVFAALETTLGTVVAVTGSNACMITKFNINNKVAKLNRADKTGTRSRPRGIGGARTTEWDVELSHVPNGTAGTKPDADPFLTALFGVAPTVVAATSVTYNLSDAVKSLNVYSYRQPSTIDQRVLVGAIVTSATFNIGQDGIVTAKYQGQAIWGLESNQFSAADATQKGGLSSFAAEPGSPVTNGTPIAGFLGSATLGGTLLANFKSATVTIETGNSLSQPFGTAYRTQVAEDFRKVTTTFSLFEDDSAGFAALIAAAEAKTPITITYVIGNTAGATTTITLTGVQLDCPTRDEQGRYVVNFPEAQAHGTGNKDEVTLAIT